MAINTTEIQRVYNSFFNTQKGKLDTLYTDKVIDAETYNTMIIEATNRSLELAINAVTRQEEVKVNLYKDKQLLSLPADFLAETI